MSEKADQALSPGFCLIFIYLGEFLPITKTRRAICNRGYTRYNKRNHTTPELFLDMPGRVIPSKLPVHKSLIYGNERL